MKTTEAASILAKDALIAKAIQSVTDGKFSPQLSFIRGEFVETDEHNLRVIIENHLNVATIKRSMYAAREHKDSRHQVDFVVGIFLEEVQLEDRSSEKIKADEELAFLLGEEVSWDGDISMVVVVMDENEIKMSRFNVIESKHKGEVFRVVSPTPVSVKSTLETKKLFTLGEKTLPNLLNFSDREKDMFHRDLASFTDTFSKDISIFPEKSEFIKKRDGNPAGKAVVKKKNKFGY